MLGKRVLVENLHAVAENDGVGDLHHRGLDVQREHHACLVGVFDFFLIELEQRIFAHVHAVNDFAIEQRNFGLEDDGFAAFSDQLHLDLTGAVQRDGLFSMVKIACVHVRDVRA